MLLVTTVAPSCGCSIWTTSQCVWCQFLDNMPALRAWACITRYLKYQFYNFWPPSLACNCASLFVLWPEAACGFCGLQRPRKFKKLSGRKASPIFPPILSSPCKMAHLLGYKTNLQLVHELASQSWPRLILVLFLEIVHPFLFYNPRLPVAACGLLQPPEDAVVKNTFRYYIGT